MKSVLLVAFACCFALALAEVGKKCNSGTDCDAGECCLNEGLFKSATCQKLREDGEDCFYNRYLDKYKIRDMYTLMCPCTEGLTCIAKETEEDNLL